MKRHADDLPTECANCGATEDLHVHHIVPLVVGGSNRRSNLCVLCGECHGLVHGLGLKNHTKAVVIGMETARSEGRWARGKVPYGYQPGRQLGTIEINARESVVVNLAFKWRYKDELSLVDIEKGLKSFGLKSRHTENFGASALRQILDSDVVFGGIHFGVEFPQIVDESYRPLREEFKAKYTRDSGIVRLPKRPGFPFYLDLPLDFIDSA